MRKRVLFGLEEFRRRVAGTQRQMDNRGIRTLLIVDPANINYLTGYDGWSFYAHQGVLVRADDPQPVWFGREQDRNGARLTSWLDDERIRTYPEDYVQSDLQHAMRYVAGLLRELGWEREPVGLEMDNYWFSARSYHQLHAALPSTDLVDATKLVNWIRLVKSEAELAYMRQSAAICRTVMDTAIEVIAEGVPEREAAALVTAAQIRGTGNWGGDSPAVMPIMPAGQWSSAGHLTFNPDRHYRRDDLVLLELSGCRYRYNTPLYRTVFVGKPPQKLLRIADRVLQATDDLLSTIRPGTTAEAVFTRWKEAMQPHFDVSGSRVGYSYGLNYVPDWGEHTVNLREGDTTELIPGMTLHLIPGVRSEDLVFEASEPVLVTNGGYERFIDYPRELIVRSASSP